MNSEGGAFLPGLSCRASCLEGVGGRAGADPEHRAVLLWACLGGAVLAKGSISGSGSRPQARLPVEDPSLLKQERKEWSRASCC